MRELTEREAAVLVAIVQLHIERAEPVGSRTLARHYLTDLSPATVRNTMADLEEMGLLTKPHTSAGREPSALGYRLYLRSLMAPPALEDNDRQVIEHLIREHMSARDADSILTSIAQALASVSRQIGVAFLPSFDRGEFRSLELIPVSGQNVLVIIEVLGGPVHTLTLQLASPVRREVLHLTAQVLNERLSGLSVGEIRQSIKERLQDVADGNREIISIFIREGNDIFDLDSRTSIHMEGRPNVLDLPEFEDRAMLSDFMRALDEQALYQLLRLRGDKRDVSVTIGPENAITGLDTCAILARGYSVGSMSGTLAIMGPMRMPYRRLVAALQHAGDVVEDLLN